jgi:hypothetical protein
MEALSIFRHGSKRLMRMIFSLRLYILLLLLSLPAFPVQRISGWCENGGTTLTIQGFSGLPTTPKVQASYPGCTVNVYLTGTTTHATIYSDANNTPKSNPFTADTTGYWFAYIPDNVLVDAALSGAGMPSVTRSRLGLGATISLNPTLFAGADLGAQINAAAASCPASGCRIEIPPGTYTITNQIAISQPNIWLHGQGNGAVTLVQAFTGDLIYVTGGANSNFSMDGITLNGNGYSTGYSLLHAFTASNGRVWNNVFTDTRSPAFNTLIGIRIEGNAGTASQFWDIHDNRLTVPWIGFSVAANANLNAFHDNTEINCGEPFDFNGAQNPSSDNSFEHNMVSGGMGAAFLESASGSRIIGNTFSQAGTTTQPTINVHLTTGGPQHRTLIENNMFVGSASTAQCLNIYDNSDETLVSGNIFDSCGQDGIFISTAAGAVSNLVVSNNIFHDDGQQSATGGYSAITVNANGSNSIAHSQILNNVAYDDQGTQTQTYGLKTIGTPAPFDINVSGNDFSRNKTGAFSFATFPLSSVIGPNRETSSANNMQTPFTTTVGSSTAPGGGRTFTNPLLSASVYDASDSTSNSASQGDGTLAPIQTIHTYETGAASIVPQYLQNDFLAGAKGHLYGQMISTNAYQGSDPGVVANNWVILDDSNWWINSCTRSNNIATCTIYGSGPPFIFDGIYVSGVSDTSFNTPGAVVPTSSSTYSFSYANTGPNTSAGTTGGVVSVNHQFFGFEVNMTNLNHDPGSITPISASGSVNNLPFWGITSTNTSFTATNPTGGANQTNYPMSAGFFSNGTEYNGYLCQDAIDSCFTAGYPKVGSPALSMKAGFTARPQAPATTGQNYSSVAMQFTDSVDNGAGFYDEKSWLVRYQPDSTTTANSAGAITYQDPSGNVFMRLHDGGQWEAANSTASAPSYSFTGDASSGMYRDSGGVIHIALGATNQLNITSGGISVGTGNVGLTVTKTMTGSGGASCTMTFQGGLLTATTCP